MKLRSWYLMSELVKATGLPRDTIRNDMRTDHLRAARRVEHRGFKQVWRFAKADVETWLEGRLTRNAKVWASKAELTRSKR
jgi:hypothetical protein